MGKIQDIKTKMEQLTIEIQARKDEREELKKELDTELLRDKEFVIENGIFYAINVEINTKGNLHIRQENGSGRDTIFIEKDSKKGFLKELTRILDAESEQLSRKEG